MKKTSKTISFLGIIFIIFNVLISANPAFAALSFTANDITGDTGTSFRASAGDVDGDGDIDIHVANSSSEQNKLWINDGSGNFTANDISGDTGNSLSSVMGDIDGDGDLDIYVANFSGQNKLWINDGSGNFTANDISGDTGGNTYALMVDFDDDDDLDIISANKLWINDGSGNFSLNSNLPNDANTLVVAAADFDGDDDIDVYVRDFNIEPGFPPEPAYDKLYFNNGSDEFDTSIQIDIQNSQDTMAADFDGDDDIDLYVANDAQNKLLINDGSASFDYVDIISDTDGDRITLGDVDNDGDIDIYVTDNGQNRLFLNDGSANFTISNITGDTTLGSGGVVADLDNDGDNDIYVTNSSGQNKLWINPNYPPSNITLLNSAVRDEVIWPSYIIGILSVTDRDSSDTHTYSLNCNSAGADDASFVITGGTNLQTNTTLDFRSRSSYEVCVRVSDGNTGYYDKTFTIVVDRPGSSSGSKPLSSRSSKKTDTTPTQSSNNNLETKNSCSREIVITQKLSWGDRDGSFGLYQKAVVNQVNNLQRLLNGLGYGNNLVIDGIFGRLTKQSVERFQQATGIIIDGIVGPETQKVFNQSCNN